MKRPYQPPHVKWSRQIRSLDGLCVDRLTTRQQSAAFFAVISYLANACEKPRVTKSEIYNALETAASWAESNSPE